MAALAPPIESDLVPVSEAVLASRADGTGRVRVGMRATPKTG
ncbi:hypothetical protein [Saccharothrix sp. 6-C]|nr:hypothetical protein [Saccharothrix sp. 6-C]